MLHQISSSRYNKSPPTLYSLFVDVQLMPPTIVHYSSSPMLHNQFTNSLPMPILQCIPLLHQFSTSLLPILHKYSTSSTDAPPAPRVVLALSVHTFHQCVDFSPRDPALLPLLDLGGGSDWKEREGLPEGR